MTHIYTTTFGLIDDWNKRNQPEATGAQGRHEGKDIHIRSQDERDQLEFKNIREESSSSNLYVSFSGHSR